MYGRMPERGDAVIDRSLEEVIRGRRGGPRRRAVDGLIVDDRWVWLVLGDDEVDTVGMLIGEAGEAPEDRTRLCRRIDGDRLVMGEPDPLQDRLLSQLLDEDEPSLG